MSRFVFAFHECVIVFKFFGGEIVALQVIAETIMVSPRGCFMKKATAELKLWGKAICCAFMILSFEKQRMVVGAES